MFLRNRMRQSSVQVQTPPPPQTGSEIGGFTNDGRFLPEIMERSRGYNNQFIPNIREREAILIIPDSSLMSSRRLHSINFTANRSER
jgi:hypothetical protein